MHSLLTMTDAGDSESLQLSLRLAAAEGIEAYKATIELAEIGLVVESIESDLRGAIVQAAEQCAISLRARGYWVTADDVFRALHDALEGSRAYTDESGAFGPN